MKVHSVSAHSKLTIGKRKLKQVGVITKKIASVLKVDETEFETDVGTNIDEETKKKANGFDFLVECMKEKLMVSKMTEATHSDFDSKLVESC